MSCQKPVSTKIYSASTASPDAWCKCLRMRMLLSALSGTTQAWNYFTALPFFFFLFSTRVSASICMQKGALALLTHNRECNVQIASAHVCKWSPMRKRSEEFGGDAQGIRGGKSTHAHNFYEYGFNSGTEGKIQRHSFWNVLKFKSHNELGGLGGGVGGGGRGSQSSDNIVNQVLLLSGVSAASFPSSGSARTVDITHTTPPPAPQREKADPPLAS